ncbi:MAG: hypothetical protein WDM88_13695 [Galbitalea sp.]
MTGSLRPSKGRARAVAHWRDSDEEYLAMIRACKAAIAAGDAYQLCLTTQVRVEAAPGCRDGRSGGDLSRASGI